VTNPWYVYECVPLLKHLAGFNSDNSGSNSNSVLTQFIQHMNKATLSSVRSFIEDKKSCKAGYEGQDPGYLVESEGEFQCCSTPWGENSSPQTVCYPQFARCDGRCVPHDWVNDGWPDCLDGADEDAFNLGEKVLPFQLGCVHCAGVILSAGFLCIESNGGLTRNCVEQVMGPGQCNVCIGEYMNLS